MKNNWYASFRKQLTIRFLIIMCVWSGFLLLILTGIRSKALLEASKGVLQPQDFYYFYLHHFWEINTIVFTCSFILILLVFIITFFKGMDDLLLCMQGKTTKQKKIITFIFPQFEQMQTRVLDLLKQKDLSEYVSAQEKEHKNQLLMYLAHDLKTPLTSMIGYINHILDHPLSKEEEEKSLEIAHSKAKRLDALMNEFSEILRYDDKVSSLDIVDLDLTSMLNQQLAGFDPLLEAKGMHVHKDLPANVWMQGDFDKLQRVFDNLMRNAINYAKEASDIEITVSQKKDGISLIYRNEAEHISKEEVSHLFDKFYRVQSDRSSMSGGAGLGLAIAQEIMELHHGSIEAKLEGSKIAFYLYLPKRWENTL